MLPATVTGGENLLLCVLVCARAGVCVCVHAWQCYFCIYMQSKFILLALSQIDSPGVATASEDSRRFYWIVPRTSPLLRGDGCSRQRALPAFNH